jgi:glycosyltransferase involved in cell wall biosynthesis
LPAERPRLAAVAPGPPFASDTWSGTSAYLLSALASAGALAGAVDGGSRALDRLEQLASFSTDRARWRQRYHARSSPLSGAVRALRSRLASRRLASVHGADGVLQIGGWHDRLRCSYHDGNLGVSLAREELALDPRSRGVRRALEAERRLYDRVDLIMPMSDWLRRSFLDDFEQDPSKVVTVGAGANLRAIPEAPERDFDRPVYLFVGLQWERKGGPELLEAFKHVRAERPNAELVVVGQRRPPEALPGVRFLGRISRDSPEGERRLDEVYREATAFVMPSRYEPFGIVFLEAMAYRLPCIGSTRCAMPEIVADGETGFVVPALDGEALAERMLALADPDRARALGEAGHQRFLGRFTWDRVATRMIDAVAARL